MLFYVYFYKAKTMCITRFDSQGMILNGFYEKSFFEEKKLNGARDPLPTSWQMPLNISLFLGGILS